MAPESEELVTRVVTWNANDVYLFRDNVDDNLKGIAIELWNETAKDLGIQFTITEAESWGEMIHHFKDKTADIIVERIAEGSMLRSLTK